MDDLRWSVGFRYIGHVFYFISSDAMYGLILFFHMRFSRSPLPVRTPLHLIRFPPLAALVCYIRPMSSLCLTFLYEQHWIRFKLFRSSFMEKKCTDAPEFKSLNKKSLSNPLLATSDVMWAGRMPTTF